METWEVWGCTGIRLQDIRSGMTAAVKTEVTFACVFIYQDSCMFDRKRFRWHDPYDDDK